jgi:hypothetical protein
MSWMAMTAPVCHQLEAGFQQAFFGERVADLNGGALFLDGFVELGRGHGRAADAVAAGLGAEIDHRQADALGFRVGRSLSVLAMPAAKALTRQLPL